VFGQKWRPAVRQLWPTVMTHSAMAAMAPGQAPESPEYCLLRSAPAEWLARRAELLACRRSLQVAEATQRVVLALASPPVREVVTEAALPMRLVRSGFQSDASALAPWRFPQSVSRLARSAHWDPRDCRRNNRSRRREEGARAARPGRTLSCSCADLSLERWGGPLLRFPAARKKCACLHRLP
jgi:hypothetical protein